MHGGSGRMNRYKEWFIVIQDGRAPFIAYPIIDKDNYIEGWMDTDEVAHPCYDDDLVSVLNLEDFMRVER